MKIVDVNVLVYAVNEDSSQHVIAENWLQEALSGTETVGFSWLALTAFLRLTTGSHTMATPLTLDVAVEQVQRWLGSAAAVVAKPTERHLLLVRSLLAPLNTGGNLVNDAHLAALAIEHNGAVVSFDTDFALFHGVRWHRPGL